MFITLPFIAITVYFLPNLFSVLDRSGFCCSMRALVISAFHHTCTVSCDNHGCVLTAFPPDPSTSSALVLLFLWGNERVKMGLFNDQLKLEWSAKRSVVQLFYCNSL